MADDSRVQPATAEQQLEAIQETQREHGAVLRSITDTLAQLLDILTPKVMDGPTLDEILAQLVSQVSDQGVMLRRIDGTTVEIRTILDPSRAEDRGNETDPRAAAGNGTPTA